MLPILSLVFLTFMCVALGILTMTEKTPALSRLLRLHDASGVDIARDPEEMSERRDLREGLAALATQFAGKAGRPDGKGYGSVRLRLIQAGYRRPSALSVYMGSRVALTLFLGTIVLTTPLTWGMENLHMFGALAGAAGLGFVLPGMFVDQQRRRRQRDIQRGLPDVIDLMVVCLEAGLGLSAALLRVATEFAQSNPTIASEFRLVVLETQAGKSNSHALRGLAERTGVADISSFVAMLIQTERFGTDLADTFRVHSEAMRHARLLAAEELAQKAPVKMLVPAACFIFPATLIVTIGPGIMQIMKAFE
ncbi:MAG: type II secretion system F family protein [bacterium]|nr:type II secretion system F family protein [bacterium]